MLASAFPAFFAACETDMNYDAISTEISFDIAELKNNGEPFKIHQRFEFDRDLSTVSSMRLNEAWLSSPISGSWDEESIARINDVYSLDVVKSIRIYLVTNDTVLEEWMDIPSEYLTGKDAQFAFYEVGKNNYGDLRDYLDANQQLEIEIDLALEPHEVSRYWRDVCDLSETCIMHLPLSMQFKMGK